MSIYPFWKWCFLIFRNLGALPGPNSALILDPYPPIISQNIPDTERITRALLSLLFGSTIR